MAAPMPAIKGTMGSTPYYVVTITARELINSARPAAERDGWTGASIDERMQREPDIKRVKAQIVPYLAQHKDRFFGSIIVVVPAGSLHFESIASLVSKLPLAYRDEGEQLGFLTLGKGDRVILDGQHRWYAEREVVLSQEDLGDEQSRVGDDEVSVIFIEDVDPRKTRRIFNKVNRYAKPTSRADNILTSEDDGYSIITRWLVDNDREDAPLKQLEETDADGQVTKREVVYWRGSTLSKTMRQLTTIGTIYDNVKTILHFDGRKDLDRIVSPPKSVLEESYQKVVPWFDTLLDKLDAYKIAIDNPESVKVNRFTSDHKHTLLLRPVGQVALVRGITRAMDLSRDSVTDTPLLSLDEAIRRVNLVNFSGNPDSIWRDTIVRANGRMVARNEAYNLAADLLTHLIGGEYEPAEKTKAVWTAWNRARGKAVSLDEIEKARQEERTTDLPEDLPDPVNRA